MILSLVEFFMYGTIFGIVFLLCLQQARSAFLEHKRFVKPLSKFIKSPLSNYSFIQRSNYFVQLMYEKYVIYIDLSKEEINIFDDKENLVMFKTKSNEKLINHLYERFNSGFHKEIHEDVIHINGITISPHLLPKDNDEPIVETYESVPTVDEILDKISKLGINNLTKKELKILRNKSED